MPCVVVILSRQPVGILTRQPVGILTRQPVVILSHQAKDLAFDTRRRARSFASLRMTARLRSG